MGIVGGFPLSDFGRWRPQARFLVTQVCAAKTTTTLRSHGVLVVSKTQQVMVALTHRPVDRRWQGSALASPVRTTAHHSLVLLVGSLVDTVTAHNTRAEPGKRL